MRAMIRFALFILFLAIYPNIAIAATVYGNIYDLSLNKVLGARLEVNTTPEQIFISKDGSYSFDIPDGFYNIKAEFRNGGDIASETMDILVSGDGNYVIDIILFPSFEEEDDISQDIGITIPETKDSGITSLIVFLIFLLLGITVYIIFRFKKRKNVGKDKTNNDESFDDNEKYTDKILEIIKKEGGRITQKQIRKEIPLSEAKISLMIAELEHKGIIEKIKKGRGNILILKKNRD